MQYYYYINSKKEKDGPHDLVSMMRRINSGMVTPVTLVYRGEDEPTSAHVLDELAPFFNRPIGDIRGDIYEKPELSFARFLSFGWEFLTENPSMMVFSGFTLAMSILSGILINGIMGTSAGVAAGWAIFMLLHGYGFLVALRLSRGQRVDLDFIDKMLSPISRQMLAIAMIFSILVAVGALLFILPSLSAMFIFAFSCMVMFDRRCGVGEAIKFARTLPRRVDREIASKMLVLIFAYLVLSALLFPIPVIMPIFLGSMSDIYERLISSGHTTELE